MNTVRCEQNRVALHLWTCPRDVPFGTPCAKRKIHPAPQPAVERGKMRSPEISCKNKMRSYVGENDSQEAHGCASLFNRASFCKKKLAVKY